MLLLSLPHIFLQLSFRGIVAESIPSAKHEGEHYELDYPHIPVSIAKITTPATMANHSRLLNSPATAFISPIKVFSLLILLLSL